MTSGIVNNVDINLMQLSPEDQEYSDATGRLSLQMKTVVRSLINTVPNSRLSSNTAPM